MVLLFVCVILHFNSLKKSLITEPFLTEKSSIFNFQATVIIFNINLTNCNCKDGLEVSQYADVRRKVIACKESKLSHDTQIALT